MYNKHEIMINAWSIRRSANVSMSIALKAAWALARPSRPLKPSPKISPGTPRSTSMTGPRAAITALMLRLLSTPTPGTVSAPSVSAMWTT